MTGEVYLVLGNMLLHPTFKGRPRSRLGLGNMISLTHYLFYSTQSPTSHLWSSWIVGIGGEGGGA